jgi:MFS family permease
MPGETEKARDDRELLELLNEIRVAIPGVQVLFAFLFAAPFASGWTKVTHLQARVFLAAFLCAAAATALFIAPTTYHRLTFRRGRREKERLLRLANIAVLAGTFMLATAISLAVFVVTAVVVSQGWAALTAVCVEMMLVSLWYVLPLLMRSRPDS